MKTIVIIAEHLLITCFITYLSVIHKDTTVALGTFIINTLTMMLRIIESDLKPKP